MRILLALALLGSVPARAGTLVVGGAGGVDFGTDQPWVGLDLAVHPDRDPDLFVPVARVTPVYALSDRGPAGIFEAGLLLRVPDQNRTVRAGLVARTWFLKTPYRLPFGWDTDCHHHDQVGFIPSVLGRIEFELGGDERPFEFGVEGGVGSSASAYLCAGAPDQADCISWFPGFVGGFYGRGNLTGRLYLEGLVGPTSRVGVGARL